MFARFRRPARISRMFQISIVGRAAQILDRSERRKLLAVTLVQIAMGFLDLLGIAIIGILGALAVVGVQSKNPGDRVSTALRFLQLDSLTFQNQMAVLGALAALVLVARTVFSVIFTRRILFFLSARGARISTELISKLLSKDLLEIQKVSAQETVYSLTAGVNAIVIGILATTVTVISDATLLIVITLGLIFVDIKIAISSFLLFGIIGFVLYRIMSVRARKLGVRNAELSINSNQKILEVLDSYRESVVKNRRYYYAREIGKTRYELASSQAELAFMPNVSKYVIETAVVIGALLISATQFLLQDAGHAVGTLAVFLAAGTRIAPAVLRIQQGAIQIRGSIGSADPTLRLIDQLKSSSTTLETSDKLERTHIGFVPKVSIKNLTMNYPDTKVSAITDLTLEVEENSVVALVGASGAGKTTLADLILGVLEPSRGSITISDISPLECASRWPGAISYVPQNVSVINGTIRENVTLGYPAHDVKDDVVIECLANASLQVFVESLPDGLNSQVGDGGSRLSGGQKQRLGIARALLTNPKLLVLDEATSALDGETEADITDAIYKLKGATTVIIIAHRLSTIVEADKVVYMEHGRIVAQGKFAEVRSAAPNFDHQANLMGIK